MTVKYVSPGIIIDDIVWPDGQTWMATLGGGGPQSAWGMALAAPIGNEVGVIAGVGHDFPRESLAPLAAMHIDLSGVHITDLPTPRAWQLLEADGRRAHVWRVDQLTSDRQTHPDWQTILQFYPNAQVVHWGIHPEDPYLEPCAPLRARGISVSIEPFKALEEPLDDATLRSLVGSCDIFSPNWREAVSLFGTDDRLKLLRRAQAQGGHLLVLRKGEDGAEAWNLRTGQGVAVPPAPASVVVDPVGAGDAFCGAFAVTWQITGALSASAVAGAVAASFMLEQVGLPVERPPDSVVHARQKAVEAGVQPLNIGML